LLTGLGDKSIDSNAKRSNTNVTVLEWINRRPEYASRVAAFASWDVFPFIINAARSRVLVNAGWQDIPSAGNSAEADVWNDVAGELPRVWPGVRYDVFTYKAAHDHLRHHQPRVLYVALGETDDWAHEGRYDLYLDAAWRNDRYIQHLWETAQSLPEYQGKTSLVLTTDHGRGDGREGWKSHGVEYEGSQRMWIALMGPDTPALGIRENVSVTQSQVAATTAALLGLDFCAQDRRVAAPLPGAVDVGESE
jgi:hypothetical protein